MISANEARNNAAVLQVEYHLPKIDSIIQEAIGRGHRQAVLRIPALEKKERRQQLQVGPLPDAVHNNIMQVLRVAGYRTRFSTFYSDYDPNHVYAYIVVEW